MIPHGQMKIAELYLLVGFVLLVPPVRNHHVVEGAPLSEWQRVGTYADIATCFDHGSLYQNVHDPNGFWSDDSDERGQRHEDRPRCYDENDPALK